MLLTIGYPQTILTAADTPEDRTLSGMLLPYGETGWTSAGAVTVAAGAITIPDLDADGTNVWLNLEHDQTRRIGRAIRFEETDAGLAASFTIARTRAADDALAEAAEGMRTGLSVEIEDPVIRGGALISGALTGAGLVTTPAFASAGLAAAAPDTGTVPPPATDTPEPDTTTTEEEPHMDPDETTQPQPATAPMTAALSAQTTKGKDWLFRALADAHTHGMTAALSDVTGATVLGLDQPQYVGELWQGAAYERRIVPLFNHADLTSFKINGWRWTTKPAVTSYAGNKVAIGSAGVATEEVTITAERWAQGWDIDRRYIDLPDGGFLAAFFTAVTEAAKKYTDILTLTKIKAAAPIIVPGAVPAGVAKGLARTIDGILAILAATDTMPQAALVAPNLWREIMLTTDDNRLAYLSSALGFQEGTLTPSNFSLMPSAALASDEVLVATRNAATVHELGGGSPIRVNALNIAQGGFDEAVFGYIAVNVHAAGGLALVKVA